MHWKKFQALFNFRVSQLVWTLPTAAAILVIETSIVTGITLPVPFLVIIVTVVFAGANGGRNSGAIAGIMASLFLVRAYMAQFGPATLTGGVPQAVLGSALFMLVGIQLGRLKDHRDSLLRDLRKKEHFLETSLSEETAEKDRQSALVAESEVRLKNAVRIAGIGHYAFDAATAQCEFCSEQHAAHFSMTPEEFCASTAGFDQPLLHVHENDRQIVWDAISRIDAGEPKTFEYRGLRPNGEIRFILEIEEPVFDEAGNHIKSVGTSMDMTDLREAEMRVRQSQRIEAIGTLTGGVAHDFNNLLAVILGNLELIREDGQAEDWPDLIDAAIKATERGASLTRNLLSFARRAHLEPTRLNLNQLVQKTMGWSTRVVPATIIIENSLQAGLWEVELDATSTENALINILLNARDAMPDGGKLTIETSNMRIGEEYVSERHEDIEPGRYVMLAISDTGHGISDENLAKVFEPFHTGKPVGQGSGLGLSMVHGFIKQSKGAVRLYSEPGVGTTIKLYFRAAEHDETDPPVEIFEQRNLKGHAEILVAEDQIEVMNVLTRILENEGYSVTTANSGDAALELFKSNRQFDLLLTDVVMPGELQGPALAKAIRLIDPNLPCIFLSGYASEATVHGNGLKPSDIRLMKPVSRRNLLQAISKALQTGGD